MEGGQQGDRRGVVARHREKLKPGRLDLSEQLGWVSGELAERCLDAQLPDRCGADENLGFVNPSPCLGRPLR